MALGPFAAMLAIFLVLGIRAPSAWGFPAFNLSGLLAVALLERDRASLRPGRLVAGTVTAFIVCLAAYQAYFVLRPDITGRPTRANFPGQAIGAYFTDAFRAATGRELRIVVGSTWFAGNVAFYSPDRPSVLIDGDFRLSPWISQERLRREGALVVWPAAPTGDWTPYPGQHELPTLSREQSTMFPRQGREQSLVPVGLAWDIIYPEGVRPLPAQ
jgi:hypothetical protein